MTEIMTFLILGGIVSFVGVLFGINKKTSYDIIYALFFTVVLSFLLFIMGMVCYQGTPASKKVMEEGAVYKTLFVYKSKGGSFILVKNKKDKIELYGPIIRDYSISIDTLIKVVKDKDGSNKLAPINSN